MSIDHPPLTTDDAPFDRDNPEWTTEMFGRAKSLAAFPRLEAALKRKPGRPAGSSTSDRQQVTLRIPRSAIDRLKAAGPGWQTRAVEAILRATDGL